MNLKKYFRTLAIACLLHVGTATNAQLIVYEPASDAQAGGTNLTISTYTLGLFNSDPDGGLSSISAGNGLPASNTGTPTGTSTGLRNTWGGDVKVVTGLTYSNSGGTLTTTGNALSSNTTNTTWGGQPSIYRNMTSDPFLNSRIGGTNTGNLGYNASGSKVLYFSALLNTNDIAATSQFMFKGQADLPFDISGSQWRFDGQNLGAAVANTTVYVVVKFTFTDATNTVIGVSLGTPTRTISKAVGSYISSFQWRSGQLKLTVDEIRLGLTLSDVMPYTPNTYYISSTGNDASSGTSILNAWASISKLNTINLKPRESVLFEGGAAFSGTINLDASDANDKNNPVLISSYGTGKATINSTAEGFVAYNTQGFTLSNLIFVGSGINTSTSRGVWVKVDPLGDVQFYNILIKDLEITQYGTTGLAINSLPASTTNTGFNNLVVDGVYVHHVRDKGIVVYGDKVTQSSVGLPHHNITIKNCKLHDMPGYADATSHRGSGIVMSHVDGGLIENCVSYNNGSANSHVGGPGGIWAWACNNIIIQKCESYNNSNGTGIDGFGFDFDGGITNSIFQYNYSHNNAGAGFLFCQFDNARPWGNNVMRYNISENDGRTNAASIAFYKGANTTFEGLQIYNNTIYTTPSATNSTEAAFYIQSSGNTGINGVTVYNNIFQTTGGTPLVDIPTGYSAKFEGNLYWSTGGSFKIQYQGVTYTDLASWRTATSNEKNGVTSTGVVANPLLTNVGLNAIVYPNPPNLLEAYALGTSSPALNTGLDLLTLYGISNGGRDFYNNSAPLGSAYEIGAFESILAPSEPTGLNATAINNNSFALNWTASVTAGVTYEVYKNGTFLASIGAGVTTYNVTGLTAATEYAMTVKALKSAVYSVSSAALGVRTTNSSANELLVYEAGNYTLAATNSDPDAGVNSGNGLPVSNIGGNPSGTGVGLRNAWGTDVTVVSGLNYTNGSYSLNTSANALTHVSSSGWAQNTTWIYRSMSTDPFNYFRSAASPNYLGWNVAKGTTELYFSVLLKASTVSGTPALYLKTSLDASGIALQLNGTNWVASKGGTTIGVLGAATANTTVFVVGKFVFTDATHTTLNFWFNPSLGTTLGAATLSVTYNILGDFQGLQFKDGNSILTVDEFRLGLKASDVMPFTASISSAVTASSLALTPASNITVANGGSLTVNTSNTINNIDVEAGAALIATSPLSAARVTLKAGKTNSFSAKLDANITANSIRLFKTIDDLQWYFISFPCDVNVGDITKSDGSSLGTLGTGGDWFIKYYDGQKRASSGPGDNWKHIATASDPTKLIANRGYIIGLKSIGATYDVELLFPLTAAVLQTEADNRSIPVSTFTGVAGGNNYGWNLIGQPFMSNFNGNGKTTSPFMSIPDGNSVTYTQVSNAENNTLLPLSAYFVQVTDATPISFNLSGRQVVRANVDNDPADRLRLSFETTTGIDFTSLVIDDNQSTAYEIGQDLEKFIGIGTSKPQVYTLLGGVNYAFNALPMNNVVDLPIGFYSRTASRTTVSVDASAAPMLSKLLLTDNKSTPAGTTTDLLTSNYTFDATAGTDNARFSITAQRIINLNEDLETTKDQPKIVLENSTITIQSLSANSTIHIVDALGRIVLNKKNNGTTVQLQLAGLGIYCVHIQSGQQSWTRKIINK